MVADPPGRPAHLSEHGGVLAGVSEGVDVPGYAGASTRPEGVIEEAQAEGHLVDDGTVVGGGLITHTPPAVHKLQPAWEREREGEGEGERERFGVILLFYIPINFILHFPSRHCLFFHCFRLKCLFYMRLQLF